MKQDLKEFLHEIKLDSVAAAASGAEADADALRRRVLPVPSTWPDAKQKKMYFTAKNERKKLRRLTVRVMDGREVNLNFQISVSAQYNVESIASICIRPRHVKKKKYIMKIIKREKNKKRDFITPTTTRQ